MLQIQFHIQRLQRRGPSLRPLFCPLMFISTTVPSFDKFSEYRNIVSFCTGMCSV